MTTRLGHMRDTSRLQDSKSAQEKQLWQHCSEQSYTPKQLSHVIQCMTGQSFLYF